MRAINMASSEWPIGMTGQDKLIVSTVKVPKPAVTEGDEDADKDPQPKVPLPQTLVRIPLDVGEIGLDEKSSGDDR